MKLLSAAICLVSVVVLSGCVDDRGYRSGAYYSAGTYYRTSDRDRHYRDYDRRDWRDRRDWGDNRRDREKRYPRAIINGERVYLNR